MWLIVGQLPIKAGWWDDPLPLLDFSRSNKQWKSEPIMMKILACHDENLDRLSWNSRRFVKKSWPFVMKINPNFWLKWRPILQMKHRSKLVLNTSLLLQNIFGIGLREKHKNNTNEKRELKDNDVVLIQDDKITPRKYWRKRK